MGMDSLHDLVEIQSWIHLFQHKSPILHKEEMMAALTPESETRVLDEDLLGEILEVLREGIRSVVGKTCTMKFVKECSKIPNTRRVGVLKKLMKGEYQLVFEFVNKVLLPRMEKRIVAFVHHGVIVQAKHELEGMTVRVSNKDAEIALLKAKLIKTQSEGPGTTKVNKLRKKVDMLTA
ncbi:hypothetical protein H5410_028931 [Solanum commersonii]|uniref:Uncharacterized protein n=1 Tax=Solanum commersonii TaxID=4109 RepID=A0A9J5Z6B4_SOLCO|nr:hypothetical protein H5410_028931 [Solanum commersonii]